MAAACCLRYRLPTNGVIHLAGDCRPARASRFRSGAAPELSRKQRRRVLAAVKPWVTPLQWGFLSSPVAAAHRRRLRELNPLCNCMSDHHRRSFRDRPRRRGRLPTSTARHHDGGPIRSAARRYRRPCSARLAPDGAILNRPRPRLRLFREYLTRRLLQPPRSRYMAARGRASCLDVTADDILCCRRRTAQARGHGRKRLPAISQRRMLASRRSCTWCDVGMRACRARLRHHRAAVAPRRRLATAWRLVRGRRPHPPERDERKLDLLVGRAGVARRRIRTAAAERETCAGYDSSSAIPCCRPPTAGLSTSCRG